MTDEQITKHKQEIDEMSQEDMARLWRFAPAGHPFFRHDLPLYEYFNKRFGELGRFTPAISKSLG